MEVQLNTNGERIKNLRYLRYKTNFKEVYRRLKQGEGVFRPEGFLGFGIN